MGLLSWSSTCVPAGTVICFTAGSATVALVVAAVCADMLTAAAISKQVKPRMRRTSLAHL